MDGIRREGSRLIGGLKWSSREDSRPLASVYLENESEERGKRGLLDGGEKRTLLLVESCTYNRSAEGYLEG